MLPPSSGGAIMGAWMTQPQMLAFAIIGGTMILFIWGRLRYDLVAILALLVSILAGTVPAKDAFSGFSDDIIIIIGSARSEEHTSELQSLMRSSYAVFCLKKKHVNKEQIQYSHLPDKSQEYIHKINNH